MKNTKTNTSIKQILEKNNLFEILTKNIKQSNRKGILTMKSIKSFTTFAVLTVLLAITQLTYAQQDDFNSMLGKLDSGSLQPLTDAFSSDINSGLFHTAKVSKKFSMYIGVKGVTTEVLEGPSSLKIKSVPFAVPQVSMGIMGTDVTVRYVPSIRIGQYGSVNMFGIAVRNSFTSYFKKAPFDAAVQFAYQKLNVNDSKDINLISSSSIAVNLQFSKQLSIFTVYAGIQYEKTGIDFTYSYEGNSQKQHVDNRNNIKSTFGLCISLGPLTLNGDYNVGRNNTISTGFGFAF